MHPCVYKYVTMVTEFLKFLKNLKCLSTNYNITDGCFNVNAYCKQSFQLHELAVWQTMLFILYLLVDILQLM